MGNWRPIETGPKDGTAVLVCCGIGPDRCHVATYVDGTWMERSGAYILPEDGEGSPTHWRPLPTVLEHARSAVRVHRLLRTAACLILLGLGIACGMLLENYLDLLP